MRALSSLTRPLLRAAPSIGGLPTALAAARLPVRAQRVALASTPGTPPALEQPPFLSDERITAEPGYNRWVQLVPACIAGTALGTYFAVPGVLGPHICRAHGVVASATCDFSMGSIVPLAAMMSLVAGVLAAGLASYSAGFGVRRVAMAGSVLFPVGIYALPALAVTSNSLAAYTAATVSVGGVGFYCIYPQIPPLLSNRWFPDRKGLACSIYFCFFGGGIIFASKLMQAMLAHFRQAPERLGGLHDMASLGCGLGEHGERLVQGAGGAPIEVVLATHRDLVASGFSGLEEGIFVVGSGSNGIFETMVGMSAVTFAMLHTSAWMYRLPHATDAARLQATASKAVADAAAAADAAIATQRCTTDAAGKPSAAAEADETAGSAAGEETKAGASAGAGAALAGHSLAQAHRTPHMYLLWTSVGALGITGLPFLLSGQFMVNDIFGGSALPSALIGASAVAFPSMVGTANMVGRGVWGPVSDVLGRGPTFGLFGLLSVPSLLLLPTATAMVPTDPETALQLFKAASLATVGVFAGGPVLLAPAVVDIFGARDATAIYGRLWMMLPMANFFGASLVAKVRDYSYAKHALAIAEACDEATFAATFGAGRAEAEALIASKTVTLPLLLPIAPAGTVDPSPLLYDDAFYTLAGFSALACVCNIAAFRLPIKAV